MKMKRRNNEKTRMKKKCINDGLTYIFESSRLCITSPVSCPPCKLHETYITLLFTPDIRFCLLHLRAQFRARILQSSLCTAPPPLFIFMLCHNTLLLCPRLHIYLSSLFVSVYHFQLFTFTSFNFFPAFFFSSQASKVSFNHRRGFPV